MKIISLQEKRKLSKLSPSQSHFQSLSDQVEDLGRELKETQALLVRVLRLLRNADISRTSSTDQDI